MAIISLVIVGLVAIFALYKYKTTEDLPKKWRKIKFESIMCWIGLSHSTMDLFYRLLDKNLDKVGMCAAMNLFKISLNLFLTFFFRALSTATQSCGRFDFKRVFKNSQKHDKISEKKN